MGKPFDACRFWPSTVFVVSAQYETACIEGLTGVNGARLANSPQNYAHFGGATQGKFFDERQP